MDHVLFCSVLYVRPYYMSVRSYKQKAINNYIWKKWLLCLVCDIGYRIATSLVSFRKVVLPPEALKCKKDYSVTNLSLAANFELTSA
jgi:hypothetical protein